MHSSRRRLVNLAAFVTAVSLGSAALTGPATAATPATPNLVKGVSYLTAPANLLGGHYYEAFAGSGFADYGLTIDSALALAATGTSDAALAGIVTFFATQGKDGSGQSINDWTSIGTPYASGGSIGKEAVLAETTGFDPRRFGGQDLIAALDASVCAQATTGDDTSCAAAGNYTYATSVFSQALGVIAQLRAHDDANAVAPITYLAGLQLPSGAFPSLIPATGDSDIDSTAIAVMALALVPTESAAVAKGIAWIASQQQTDGGFPAPAGESTNSTGLAIQALHLATGHDTAIAAARKFLAGQQNTDGGFNVGAGGQPGSDLRASAQAVAGSVGASFGTLSRDVHDLPTTSPSTTPTATTTPTTAAPGTSSDIGVATATTRAFATSSAPARSPAHASVLAASTSAAPELAATGAMPGRLLALALALLVAGSLSQLAGTRRRSARRH